MLWGIYSVIYGEVNVSVENCVEIKGDYVEKWQSCFISVTLESWTGRKFWTVPRKSSQKLQSNKQVRDSRICVHFKRSQHLQDASEFMFVFLELYLFTTNECNNLWILKNKMLRRKFKKIARIQHGGCLKGNNLNESVETYIRCITCYMNPSAWNLRFKL